MLAIDSSSSTLSVALGLENGMVIERQALNPNSHDEEIGDLVKSILDEGSLGASTLKGIILGSGPGSFTGLRIGYAFAKGLSYAAKVPICTYSSFHSAAYSKHGSTGRRIVLSDARREEVFLGIYSFGQGTPTVRVLQQPEINSLEVLKAKCEEVRGLGESLTLFSPDVQALSNVAALGLGPLCQTTNIAAGLIELHREQTSPGWVAALEQIAELKPEYLRAVAAKTIKERMGPVVSEV